MESLCLASDGPYAGKYTTARVTCDFWESGHHGAIDDPPNYGEETRKLYEQEESGA